jgi:hypothetical protein
LEYQQEQPTLVVVVVVVGIQLVMLFLLAVLVVPVSSSSKFLIRITLSSLLCYLHAERSSIWIPYLYRY